MQKHQFQSIAGHFAHFWVKQNCTQKLFSGHFFLTLNKHFCDTYQKTNAQILSNTGFRQAKGRTGGQA